LENGTLPDRLEQLVPTFLEQLPVDMFAKDEAPLNYELRDGDYHIYSVWRNQQDDGGVISNDPYIRSKDLVLHPTKRQRRALFEERALTLKQKADEFAKTGSKEVSLEMYDDAWNQLPHPKEECPAAAEIHLGIAALHQKHEDESSARSHYTYSTNLPGGNRISTYVALACLEFDQDWKEDALESFVIAFELGGKAALEELDPKYLTFVKEKFAEGGIEF